jgi:hypothetical protein
LRDQGRTGSRIVNEVRGINRIVDDVEKLSIRNTFCSVRLSAFRPRVGVYRWGRLHRRYSGRGMGRTGSSES